MFMQCHVEKLVHRLSLLETRVSTKEPKKSNEGAKILNVISWFRIFVLAV